MCVSIKERGYENSGSQAPIVSVHDFSHLPLHLLSSLSSSLPPASPIVSSRIHLHSNPMLSAIRLRVVQLKPPVLQRPRAHRSQNEFGNAPLRRALEPPTVHAYGTIGRNRDSRNQLPNRRMTDPRIIGLVDWGGQAPYVELKGRIAFEFARRILHGRGVDFEAGAADAGVDVAGHVKGDFGVDGVADFACQLGVLGRVGGVVAERNEEVRHLGRQKGAERAEAKERDEGEGAHCDGEEADGWRMFECLQNLQLKGSGLILRCRGMGIVVSLFGSGQE
jgi:hypothetical protein